MRATRQAAAAQSSASRARSEKKTTVALLKKEHAAKVQRLYRNIAFGVMAGLGGGLASGQLTRLRPAWANWVGWAAAAGSLYTVFRAKSGRDIVLAMFLAGVAAPALARASENIDMIPGSFLENLAGGGNGS